MGFGKILTSKANDFFLRAQAFERLATDERTSFIDFFFRNVENSLFYDLDGKNMEMVKFSENVF